DGTILGWDLTGGVKASKQGPRELERLWADLGDAQARRAHRAVWALVSSRGQAVSLLRKRLRPVRPADTGRLIDELGSDDFEVRPETERGLAELGDEVGPALVKALESKPPLEKRRRIERLLAELDKPNATAERRRALRAILVLERVGSRQAREVLRALSRGA